MTQDTHTPDKRAWFALAVLLAGMFMALLDSTIVNVALPSIRTSLNASESTLSWIISGYALTFGLALVPAGRIGDRIGHKWVYIVGLILFVIASAYCGIAANDFDIIVGRVLQGLAGGIFVPAVGSFIQLLFHGKNRGKAFAAMGSVIGVSSALGPIIGGLLIQAFGTTDGWRWVFFVNLPIGIVTFIFAIVVLPSGDAHADATNRMDWLGVLLLSAGLVSILVPLIQGQQDGWHAWTFELMAAGAGFLLLFAAWQVVFTKRGGTALIPPRLYSHLSFTFGTILSLVYFAGFTSIFFTISILWQAGLGHTALESGFVTLPFAIGTAVVSSQSQKAAAKFGRGTLVIGAAFVAIALTSAWLILANVGFSDLTNWIILPSMLLGGIGNGFFLAPNVQFIVATVDRSEAGAASGVVQTMQRVGTAVGVAIIGTVLFGTISGSVIRSHDDLAKAFTHAAANAMGTSAIMAVLAFLLVFALPRRVAPMGGAPVLPVAE